MYIGDWLKDLLISLAINSEISLNLNECEQVIFKK